MSKRRNELRAQLLAAGRSLGAETIFFHEAVAATMQLTATEMKVVDLLLRSGGGPLTPGDLAHSTSVTSGGMSQILDRLESVQLIERKRDEQDRRRVLVTADQRGVEALTPLYNVLEQRLVAILSGRGNGELETIAAFLADAANAFAAARRDLGLRRK